MIKKTSGPLDPTNNFAEMINDTSGLTGITKNKTYPIDSNERTDADVSNSSHLRRELNEKRAAGLDENVIHGKKRIGEVGDSVQNSNPTIDTQYPPSVHGEQSISGDMPDLESDDDVLDTAQQMGIALDEDDEHPKELHIGNGIDAAEENHHAS